MRSPRLHSRRLASSHLGRQLLFQKFRLNVEHMLRPAAGRASSASLRTGDELPRPTLAHEHRHSLRTVRYLNNRHAPIAACRGTRTTLGGATATRRARSSLRPTSRALVPCVLKSTMKKRYVSSFHGEGRLSDTPDPARRSLVAHTRLPTFQSWPRGRPLTASTPLATRRGIHPLLEAPAHTLLRDQRSPRCWRRLRPLRGTVKLRRVSYVGARG